MGRQPNHTTAFIEGDPPGRERSLPDLEHDRATTLGEVRDLEEAARSIREKGFTAHSFETISSIGLRLEEMFRRQEALEEAHLFPGLRRTDPELARSFCEEHRAARVLFGALLSTVRDIEGGRIHGSSVSDLLRTIRELVTLLRGHIIREGDALTLLIRKETRGEGPASHEV